MKFKSFIANTLDGFIADKHNDISFLDEFNRAGEDFGFSEFYDSIDTVVMGRNTYEKVSSFDDWFYSEKRVLVVSNSLKKIDKNLENVDLVEVDIEKIIKKLKHLGSKSIYVDGGKTVSLFIENDLIEEITISVIPILLGEGKPLFSAITSLKKFDLMSSRSFQCGIVENRYRKR